ncbi:MAG: GC-type dockerin domain-anchored protein [Phycisphaerales bacterium]
MNYQCLSIASLALVSTALAQPVCVSPNVSIPDDIATGVQIPIVVDVPSGALLEAITIDLDIEHLWVGDLFVSLAAPDGTAVVLLDRPGIPSSGFPGPFGCGGADVLATFDDAGLVPAESVCSLTGVPVITGAVSPFGSLSVLVGTEVSGTWTLNVSDRSSFDVGVVRSVCLDITASEPCPADLAEPFGTLNFFDVSAYLTSYVAEDPAADLAAPFGALNFFDVTAYIAQFNAGCP